MTLVTTVINSVYQVTPLHVAARGGRQCTVEWLIVEGADIAIKDNKGVSMDDCTSVCIRLMD